MSTADEDPRCPECGAPIGTTATYCMHCSADLTAEQEQADTDSDGAWDSGGRANVGGGTTTNASGETTTGTGNRLLDPDGLVDNALTIGVAILGALFIGLVATFALAFLVGGLALLGVLVWLGATAYLARQRTVQGAISKAAYGVAAVLLLVPLIPLSPFVEMDPSGRAVGAVVLLITFGFFAAVAALVGYAASRFVPGADNSGV